MASVTALNTLNIFQYNQLGNENPSLDQGVDLRKECKYRPYMLSRAVYIRPNDIQSLGSALRTINQTTTFNAISHSRSTV